jgi:hypothetical protein
MLFGFLHIRALASGRSSRKIEGSSRVPSAFGRRRRCTAATATRGILAIGREVYTSDEVRLHIEHAPKAVLSQLGISSVSADQWLTESAGNRESHRSRQYSIR